MNYKRRDVCGNKRAFKSKKQAVIALNTMRQRDNMHAYLCGFCFHWHVGHGEREHPRRR